MEKISTNEVLEWAKEFLAKSEREITKEELKERKKYAILVQRPNDKILLLKMLDESSQIHSSKILAKRIKVLIARYGIPKFFSKTDAFMLRLFTSFGYLFDFISVPIFKKKLRSDTSKVIINEEPSLLNQHLSARRKQRIGQNVNLLGEVVLGEAEADKRYYHYLEALKHSQINYISIKISGIYAQINPFNYVQNKIDLCERLMRIYEYSIEFPYIDDKGIAKSKFVNLDMEEYKDTELTIDVFKTVLSLPQFKNYSAGIAVQAYLPDAWHFQTELLTFAKKRLSEGGAALKMRLVKGANLQMESIISSLKGWENPIYDTKIEVDANYLHILDRALEPENAKAMHVGVASHNFFSIGYAYLLSTKNNVEKFVTFEMLEGMANHLPRVLLGLGKQTILYTPVVKDEHFLNAVSYLVRRLDENTGVDNFLSYSFNLKYGSEQWSFLEQQFLEAFKLKDTVSDVPKRTQNRRNPLPKIGIFDTISAKKTNLKSTDLGEKLETQNTACPNMSGKYETFFNEPDTNFDLRPNRLWADEIRTKWRKSISDMPLQIPIQIGEKELISKKKVEYFDHSQVDNIKVCELSLSNLEQVTEILSVAEKDACNWRKTTLADRSKILFQVAENLSTNRGNLIGCMAAITGKTFAESDVEVSEAIDFCRYYPISMQAFAELKTITLAPKGIVLVIPPWNFPLAIPVGGVAAALIGGNSVILKPATVAFPVAWEFAKCFWDAGVPKEAMQVVCTDGRQSLNFLTSHPFIKHIILTGGTDTAFHFLKNNPTCPLSAETGGKNAIILTASGDRDHAIQNIVTSAFSNAGQKCSACSLLLLEKEVYYDPDFKTKLIDAITSLHTGSVWDGGNVVGPMITYENDKLMHAIKNLEDGEWWLVKPEFVDKRRYILKPCVKWGVKPSSYTFKNELFAPLLAVVCIDSLKQGIEFVNASEYGLTSGLQSLDENEQLIWKNSIEAGNLYINRGITGAVVSRQPFGGMKQSAFGSGIKAGGKNYVSSFLNIKENVQIAENKDVEIVLYRFKTLLRLLNFTDKFRFQKAVESYLYNWEIEFSQEKDEHQKKGEHNTFRYLPLNNIALRVNDKDELCDVLMVLAAAGIANTHLTLSMSAQEKQFEGLKNCNQCECKLIVQSESDFLKDMYKYDRVRTCSSALSIEFYEHAAKIGKYIATAKPLTEGRIEMLHYLKEQSIAFEYHRYGSITETVE